MRGVLLIILSLIAAVGTVGCAKTDPSAVDCLRRLGGLVFIDPDSASVVLSGIRREDLRDDDSRSRYDLLQTVIDDRLGNVHQSPDGILSVRDYFVDSGASDSLLTIVHLYTGRVYEDLGEYEKALESYLTARTQAEDTTENHLKGRIFYNIGNLYHNDYDYAHASSFLEQAIQYFNAIGDTLNAANTYNLLGANHTVSGNVDKGLDALNKANEMYGDLRNRGGVISNALTIAGLYLHHLGDAARADSVMRRVHNDFNDGAVPRGHLPMMSQIEAGKGNYGKAVSLLQNYLTLTPDLPLEKMARFYYLLSYYESQMGQYHLAYDHQSEYVSAMDSLYQDKIVTVLQEVEKKYEKQTLEDEHKAYRKATFNRILVGSICFLAVISLLIVHIRKRRQEYFELEADLDGLKSQVGEFEDIKGTLSNVLDQKVEREIKLQKVLTDKMLQIQKIADYLFLYEDRPQDFKKHIHIAVIQAEKDKYFGELYDVVNEKYAGIVSYLKYEYPTLTEDELNLCCLVCFGFNNNQISILFGHTNPNSIFIKRHRLRKKMGLWPNYDSLEAYLSKLISDLQSDALGYVADDMKI